MPGLMMIPVPPQYFVVRLMIVCHRLTHKNKITGEPVWVPGRLQSNRRAQMGKAKHTRISQRMSQHIMQLKLALRIMASEEKPIKMICL